MRLYQRLIVGGLVVAGLAGLVGCKDNNAPQEQPRVSNVRYEQSIPINPVDGYAGGVSVVTGDINGDGIDELIVGDMSDIKLYRNDGRGKFSNPELIAKPNAVDGYANAIDLALSDIDKDGDLDLIAGDTKGIAIFYNDGKGNFSQ
jgi:hypothetical protein